jgi:hypothetical protein
MAGTAHVQIIGPAIIADVVGVALMTEAEVIRPNAILEMLLKRILTHIGRK